MSDDPPDLEEELKRASAWHLIDWREWGHRHAAYQIKRRDRLASDRSQSGRGDWDKKPAAARQSTSRTRNYQTNREFADSVLRQQMAILAPIVGMYAMQIASFKVDTEQAGDLTILAAPRDMKLPTIGLRVRRSHYQEVYGLREFTLRSHVPSDLPTEFHKITQQGYGGWFGYFHVDATDQLKEYAVVDLEMFRRSEPDRLGWQYQNSDGTSFRAYNLAHFSVGILIAASEGVLAQLSPLYKFSMQRRQQQLWSPY